MVFPGKSVNFEDFILICTVYPSFWALSGGGQNSEKNRRKIDFGLTGKIGKKSPKNGKNGSNIGFRAIFPIFGRFFPYFPGEAKIDFSAIFSRFRAGGPKSAFSQARMLASLVMNLPTKCLQKSLDTEYDRAEVPPCNGSDPAPGNLKALLLPDL